MGHRVVTVRTDERHDAERVAALQGQSYDSSIVAKRHCETVVSASRTGAESLPASKESLQQFVHGLVSIDECCQGIDSHYIVSMRISRWVRFKRWCLT